MSYHIVSSGSDTVTWVCPLCKTGATSMDEPTMKMCSRCEIPSAWGNSYQMGRRMGVPDTLACRNCVYMYGRILYRSWIALRMRLVASSP